MSKAEQFSNRWGIILASLGMAIGAGNLWRFPRLAGQYGGSFILLWILFLFVWSIPLLLAEFSIGKKFKRGVIGSFGLLVGEKLTWMGFFITICTLGIAFYYSVVTAWSLEYLWLSLTTFYQEVVANVTLGDRLSADEDFLTNQWSSIANKNLGTVVVYLVVVLFGVFVVSKGIKSGLEKANKILIPSLFVLLVIVAFAALSMDNGIKGLEYMFVVDWNNFSNPTIWIEALSQSAWSTGAGWGLMMTISSYAREKEDVTLNTFIGAFGNNTASILSGMAILPAVFALSASEGEALSFLQSGSQALTFTIIPRLFAEIPGGGIMTIIFFLALSIAAFSSFLPMIELFRSNVSVLSSNKKMIVILTVIVFVAFGFPSAYSLDFFSNQDWVWGLGLIISGIFIAIGTSLYGPVKFKKELIDEDSDFTIADAYFKYSIYSVIIMGVFIVYWWLSQGNSQYTWFNEDGAWNVFDVYSNASVITQWSLVILVGIAINKILFKKFCSKT
ncbi:MAG: sodium-dependent transporter [Cyclobacteriaceae bacterium]